MGSCGRAVTDQAAEASYGPESRNSCARDALVSMADADIRWLQRLGNYERALAALQRALTLAASRPLIELELMG